MNFLLLRHRVADFARWKAAYDAHTPSRTAAGLKQKELLQDVNDPNQIVLLFEVADLQKAKAFMESADLQEAMRGAGVAGIPDLYFLRR